MSSNWVSPKNGRKRKYYTVTDKGGGRLAFKRRQWREFSQAADRFWRGDLRKRKEISDFLAEIGGKIAEMIAAA